MLTTADTRLSSLEIAYIHSYHINVYATSPFTFTYTPETHSLSHVFMPFLPYPNVKLLDAYLIAFWAPFNLLSFQL